MSKFVYVLSLTSTELIFGITARFCFFDDLDVLDEFMKTIDTDFNIDIMNLALVEIKTQEGENYYLYSCDNYNLMRFDVSSYYDDKNILKEPICFMKTDGPSGECCGLFLTRKHEYFATSGVYMSEMMDLNEYEPDEFKYTYGRDKKFRYIECRHEDSSCMSFDFYYDINFNVTKQF